jgi:hypothetical protein
VVVGAGVTVRVEFPGPVEAGLTVHVVKDAGQVGTRLTLLLNPLMAVTVTVEVPCWPWFSVNDEGLAESEKSGVGAAPQLPNINDPMRVYQP